MVDHASLTALLPVLNDMHKELGASAEFQDSESQMHLSDALEHIIAGRSYGASMSVALLGTAAEARVNAARLMLGLPRIHALNPEDRAVRHSSGYRSR